MRGCGRPRRALPQFERHHLRALGMRRLLCFQSLWAMQRRDTDMIERALEAAAIAPERALSDWINSETGCGALRLDNNRVEGATLLSLTLPFGYPSRGCRDGRGRSSIHSCPPWRYTGFPGVVGDRLGTGRALYSATDLESGATESHGAPAELPPVVNWVEGPIHGDGASACVDDRLQSAGRVARYRLVRESGGHVAAAADSRIRDRVTPAVGATH